MSDGLKLTLPRVEIEDLVISETISVTSPLRCGVVLAIFSATVVSSNGFLVVMMASWSGGVGSIGGLPTKTQQIQYSPIVILHVNF